MIKCYTYLYYLYFNEIYLVHFKFVYIYVLITDYALMNIMYEL